MPTPTRRAWMNAWEGDLTPSAAERRSAARVAARMASTRYYGREATARLPRQAIALERSRPLPELRVVTRRRPRWGMIALALVTVVVLLGACIVAPMLIHSATTAVESKVGQIESQQRELVAVNSALSAQISSLSSPDRVAEQAAQLGLGPPGSVRYVETGSGSAATEGDTTVAGR